LEVDVPLTYQVAEAEGPNVCIQLFGSLADADWTGELRQFMDVHYLDDGVEFILIDLSHVDRIDLEGVATLLRLSADAIARGKSLGVTGATNGVWSKLKQTSALSHLDKAG
jgi:ABC-type transporter Mla MlaB component